jgi:4-hydroxy-tetrahydrodipicolinate synthase
VTVRTQEASPWGERLCKSRNPVPVKTLMRVLGMPVGGVRRPLGRMTGKGVAKLMEAARAVWDNDPDVYRPIAEAFDVDVEKRLHDDAVPGGLIYSNEELS